MQCTVIGEFFRAVDALSEAEKAPRDYGTGHLLYHSEVNLLDAIRQNPSTNAIELSRLMGITRAAITQMGTKLEERGFLSRRAKEGNQKEKLYHLTPLGETLCEGHETYHRLANESMCEYLRGLSDHEAEIILRFLGNIIDSIPISRFECRSGNGCRGKMKEANPHAGAKKHIL